MKKLVLLLVVLGVISCGSRKVTMSKSEEKSELKTEMNTELKVEEKYNIQKDISKIGFVFTENDIEEVTYNAKPIDPDRPMTKKETVEGNTKTTVWENAEVTDMSRKDRSKKSKESKMVDNSVIESNVSSVSKTGFNQSSEDSLKNTNKSSVVSKGLSFWWIILLLIPIGYYLLNNFKKNM